MMVHCAIQTNREKEILMPRHITQNLRRNIGSLTWDLIHLHKRHQPDYHPSQDHPNFDPITKTIKEEETNNEQIKQEAD